jgi:hypothetical protein
MSENAGDLFRRFGDHRDAIAHFLLSRDGATSHVYLAEGEALQEYSMASAVLLRYAEVALSALRSFYQKHLNSRLLLGSVLPEIRHRGRYVVKEPKAGTGS